MEVTTKSRAELKARFVKNSIPTEKDFANLIDGLINLQDDGVVKAPGNPLSVQADGESSGPQKVLNLYASLKDANPAWSLSLNPRSDPNNASSARPGFNLSDGSDGRGESRLFIDRTSGNVGVGTITPGAKLEVNGSLTANGAVTIGSAQTPQPLTVSGNTTLNGNVGIGRAPDHALHIAVAKSVRFELGSGQKLSLGGNGALEVDAPGVVGGRFVVTDGGNVGIGTVSPSAKLTVSGATATTAIETAEIVRLVRPVDSGIKNRNSAGLRVGSFETGINGRARLDLTLSGPPNANNDYGNIPEVTVMSLLANGNVGIGTTSPNAKLEVKGGQTILEQQAWQDANLVNGWVNYGLNYNPAQYFKDSQGIVHLRGLIRSGTVNTDTNLGLAFTLPGGYRPSFRQLHGVCTHPNVMGRVDILSDGRVTVHVGNNDWVSLDGISFRVT